MPLLGVNIDHVATVRQARYRGKANGDASLGEPDPVIAAHEAELGGAEIITVHLREDRRHIQDRDLRLLAQITRLRLNLEMGATDEMVGIAGQIKPPPPMVTLVPEVRQEVTTEGGLDVAGQLARMRDVVSRLKASAGARGVTVSAFIDADPKQVEASKAAGFDACELHTGPFAEAFLHAGGDERLGTLHAEIDRLKDAGHRTRAIGLRLHAGHALNYVNVKAIAGIPGMTELHIGHAIVARAVFVGLRQAVSEMKAAMG